MTIKLRGDTAANWTATNPVLADRQVGLETDTQQFKVGDGATAWSSLTYWGGGGVSDGDKGDITVSGGGTVWTIDAGSVTLAKQANMATASVVYRKTAGAGAPEVQTLATLKTDLGLTGTNSGDQTTIVGITGTLAEFNDALTGADFATGGGTATGTNTGDQTITLTGDVTGSGTGSFAATIAASAVSLAKMADVATATVFYRKTAGTGAPEVQTLATLKTDLGLTGTNSGDQTSIVGITGTLAEFNAALTGADFATGGGTASGTNTGDQTITLTGDATGSGTGSFAVTLATVNANVGSFGSSTLVPVITVNAKGLITAVSTASVSGGTSSFDWGESAALRMAAITL